MRAYARGCTCVRRHLNETVLLGDITWSEIGKQNIQAKKVNFFLSGNGPYEILFTLDEQISPTGLRLKKFKNSKNSKMNYFMYTSHQASDCNNNSYSSNLKSDLDADDLLEFCVFVYD